VNIVRKLTKAQNTVGAFGWRGRKTALAGSHISDLMALGKAITLCPDHAKKFRAGGHEKRNGYASYPTIPKCRCECDACKQRTADGVIFIKQSYAAEIAATSGRNYR
jgi:hypothetical protein